MWRPASFLTRTTIDVSWNVILKHSIRMQYWHPQLVIYIIKKYHQLCKSYVNTLKRLNSKQNIETGLRPILKWQQLVFQQKYLLKKHILHIAHQYHWAHWWPPLGCAARGSVVSWPRTTHKNNNVCDMFQVMLNYDIFISIYLYKHIECKPLSWKAI